MAYEGKYLNGQRNGNGKEYDYYNSKFIFEGVYLNGKKWIGKGREYDKNNNLRFEGEYLYNHRIKGKYYNNSILEYEGERIFIW